MEGARLLAFDVAGAHRTYAITTPGIDGERTLRKYWCGIRWVVDWRRKETSNDLARSKLRRSVNQSRAHAASHVARDRRVSGRSGSHRREERAPGRRKSQRKHHRWWSRSDMGQHGGRDSPEHAPGRQRRFRTTGILHSRRWLSMTTRYATRRACCPPRSSSPEQRRLPPGTPRWASGCAAR